MESFFTIPIRQTPRSGHFVFVRGTCVLLTLQTVLSGDCSFRKPVWNRCFFFCHTKQCSLIKSTSSTTPLPKLQFHWFATGQRVVITVVQYAQKELPLKIIVILLQGLEKPSTIMFINIRPRYACRDGRIMTNYELKRSLSF
jgi:hypothetical protein